MKKILLCLLSVLMITACHKNKEELTIENAYGNHQYKELYYVGLQNKTMPDTIEDEMERNTILIEENQFCFLNYKMNNVKYVEDHFNDEERQLFFEKKYKVLENGTDSCFRIYLTYKNVFIGVYYHTSSLSYIIKLI